MTRSCTFALNNVKIPCGIPQIKICIKDCYNKMQVNSHKFSTCIHVCHLGFILHLYVKTEWHSSFTDHILSYMCSNVKSLIFQDCEDHAILLCSLLLGFGLDAYVCVGTKSKGSVHAWVVTISIEGTVVFWESLNGHRYVWCSLEIWIEMLFLWVFKAFHVANNYF